MGAARDHDLAVEANAHGARYSLRIIQEARRAHVAISLAFGLIETESGFTNVWGGDASPNGGTSGLHGKAVTKARYLTYRKERGSTGKGGMQGVGPCQLTWWEYQDRADRLGGCWVAKYNIRVALEDLSKLIAAHGERAGIKAYNGSGPAADRYARRVLARKATWHRRLEAVA